MITVEKSNRTEEETIEEIISEYGKTIPLTRHTVYTPVDLPIAGVVLQGSVLEMAYVSQPIGMCVYTKQHPLFILSSNQNPFIGVRKGTQYNGISRKTEIKIIGPKEIDMLRKDSHFSKEWDKAMKFHCKEIEASYIRSQFPIETRVVYLLRDLSDSNDENVQQKIEITHHKMGMAINAARENVTLALRALMDLNVIEKTKSRGVLYVIPNKLNTYLSQLM